VTRVIAFFNNKGGVGKTSLVFHLAWMYSDLGLRVVAADFDPQANLTAAFLDLDRLEELWPDGRHGETVFGAIEPLIRGTGDVALPHVEAITDRLGLIVGDLGLALFEDELATQWPKCLDGQERAFRVISALWRVGQLAAARHEAEIVLMDLGPNLGAMNRAALVGADHVVVPLSPDVFSLQGLRNLGPTLRRWRNEWRMRLTQKPPAAALELPGGEMRPAGYVVLQHSERLDRPVRAYQSWIRRIPEVYREEVLDQTDASPRLPADDPNCIARIKHYRSLMPMAQEVNKPIFHLKPADGALGAHYRAVQAAYGDFESLAVDVAARTSLMLPQREAY
jgi:cellulose biosynthesis protein BcsQ